MMPGHGRQRRAGPGRRVARGLLAAMAMLLAAGGAGPALTAQPAGAGADTTGLVPAGFGTLRQDDLAVRIVFSGLQVRAIPLDEAVIRALSPDSYRALRDLRESKRPRLDTLQRRLALPELDVWYVSFFNLEQGEARFSPLEVYVTSVGRDFRPLDVIPLSPGFGAQRLRQREVQHALYVFDPQVDVNQPLTVTFDVAQTTEWTSVLKRLERERALIRSRANAAAPPRP